MIVEGPGPRASVSGLDRPGRTGGPHRGFCFGDAHGRREGM